MKIQFIMAWMGVCGLQAISCAAPSSTAPVTSPPALVLKDFPHQVELEVAGAGPWYRLPLSMNAWLMSRHGDLSDVRVFNAQGEVLPYSVRRLDSSTQRASHEMQARIFPLYTPAGETNADNVRVVRNAKDTTVLEIFSTNSKDEKQQQVLRGWILDTGSDDWPLENLQLDWRAFSDGFQRVRIESSDDLEHWSFLARGQLARLDFNGQRIETNDIALPRRAARYLRVWWESPEQAAQVNQARLKGSRSSQGETPMLWSAPLTAQLDEQGHFVWTLPVALPMDQVRIPLDHPNTLAPVMLFGRRDAQSPWSPLSGGVLYRFTENGAEMKQEELKSSGQAFSQLRLKVDTRGGGLGKNTPHLSVGMRASEIVFLARGSAPYRLALGHESATDARLPLDTLVPGLDGKRLDSMGQARMVGEFQHTPGVTPTPEPPADGRWKQWSLWAVLLAGVGLLGAMAWSLLRSPRSQP